MKTQKHLAMVGILAAFAIALVVVTACGQPTDPSAPIPVGDPPVTLSGITAVYEGEDIYPFTLLDSLKDDLTVTANYSNGKKVELEPEGYTLSGTLTTPGENIIITVTYSGKTGTFTVTVTDATLDSIAVEFDQNGATIYTSTPLDSLKQYLTVTATYSFENNPETRTETLTDSQYTLSGTLTAGTPTVTVSYGGKTETFTPTVTAVVLESITAQYNATAVIYTSTQLDSLKQYLTVTAVYNDGNTPTVNDYTLSGTLTTPGENITITVSYTDDGVTKTTDFTVTVTAVALASIRAQYTGGQVTINSDIDDLKSSLTVTAVNNDGSTQAVNDYSLSGTLTTAGQKTITVTYEGKTTTFTVTVFDPYEPTPGLQYTLITEGANANTYRVSKGSVTSGAVVIPATYNGLPVTEIGSGSDGAYGGAFYNSNITSVIIPASVKAIGVYAFRDCTSLTSIVIPASVTTVGTWAFANCTGITSVTFTEGVTSINYNAFYDCTSLTTLTFAEGSESVDYFSFYDYLKSLTTVNIPASVTVINVSAFRNFSVLTSINVDANNTHYASESGILYNKAKTTLIRVPRATSGSIEIPASVTSIGDNAFSDCTRLTNINVDVANTAYASQDGILYNKAKTTLIRVPQTISGSLTIPASVTSIGGSAFSGCTGLTSITIPTSVTSVGGSAFSSWTASQTINVADHASRGFADAMWGASWRSGCNAVINYLGEPKTDITVTNTTEWNNAMTIIKIEGNNRDFTITVNGSFSVAGMLTNSAVDDYNFGAVTNLSVTLKGSGTVSLSSNGNLIRLNKNQTLIIDSENLTLQGRSGNNTNDAPLVSVGSVYVSNVTNAVLELKNGTITGNTNRSEYTNVRGGGVYVARDCAFIMSGGTISANRAYTDRVSSSSSSDASSSGGGVYSQGTFTMLGGTISGNEAYTTGNTKISSIRADGGGVYNYGGTFRLVTGTIYGNTENPANLRNTVSVAGGYAGERGTSGAALRGSGQRGTFSIPGDITSVWTSSGDLTTSETTIRVVDGVLVP